MIEHYTLKFTPAVSHKELEKTLNETTDPSALNNLTKVKVRIEILCDFEELKRVAKLLKDFSTPHG